MERVGFVNLEKFALLTQEMLDRRNECHPDTLNRHYNIYLFVEVGKIEVLSHFKVFGTYYLVTRISGQGIKLLKVKYILSPYSGEVEKIKRLERLKDRTTFLLHFTNNKMLVDIIELVSKKYHPISKVLYVGKSTGFYAGAFTFGRLDNHHVLPKVQEFYREDKNASYRVLLCNFWYRRADTINSGDDIREVQNLLKHSPSGTDYDNKTHLIEIALIKYFRPKLNRQHNNDVPFPNKAHKSYSGYIKWSYNEVYLEIDTSEMRLLLGSEKVRPHFRHERLIKFANKED